MLKLIKGGTLLDCTGSAPKQNFSVLIDGDKIVALGPEESVRVTTDDVSVFDASNMTIMPGLIDCHVHITGDGDPNILKSLKELVPHAAIKAANNARLSIEAGFTTLRDAGAASLIDVGLKNAINEGLVPGPRLFAAGRALSITGGHGDAQNGYPPEIVFARRYVVDSPDEARKAAREQLRDGADHIKLCATGGVMSFGSVPTARGMTVEEMRAAIEEANNVGKKSMAHAQGSNGIKNAILAGISSIEHGYHLTDEIIELMLARDVFLVPTLAAVHHIVEHGLEAGIPEYGVRKAKEGQQAHLASFRKALEAGIKIAMGTDAATPFNYHGKNALEFELMVEAGMSPEDAIYSATRLGAELIGILDKVGTLEKAKLADIIVVEGDPLQDIRVLQSIDKIKMVMKNGEIVVNRGV